MTLNPMSRFIQHLRREPPRSEEAGLSDGELLESYILSRNEEALAALVHRHGPMVWGTCCRVLNNPHDAEDAFQATFLVLVRRAASVMPREMIGNWLYGVAHQTALKARATIGTRKKRETQVVKMPEPAIAEQVQWDDLKPVLDEELSRLPEQYRAVVVLCDLEGRTRREAAEQLGAPEGTVAGRIARARVILAKRLTERGITLSGGGLALVLSQNVASAGMPDSVVTSTIKAATLFATGKRVSSDELSPKVATLTEGVLKAMMKSKLKVIVSVVLVVGLLTAGVSSLLPITSAQEEKPGEVAKQPPKQSTIEGVWSLVSIETVHGTSPETLRTTRLEPKGFTMIFKDNQVTHQQANKDGKMQRKTFRITLDTKTQPHRLTLHTQKHSIRYIYEVKGDTLRLCCFSLAEQDGVKLETWPTEFSTKVNRKMFPRLEVLRRVKAIEKQRGPKHAQN